MGKKLEQEIINLIEPLYLKLGSAEQVGKLLKIDPKTAVRYLKSFGYDFSNKYHKPIISYANALTKFKSWNKSLTKFCSKYHLCLGHFTKFLKKNGIYVVNYLNSVKFNESIFDSIDTEEKAYWLGFIFADGYIFSKTNSKRNYQFELSLKVDDYDHLVKFNTFMQHINNNVKINNTYCNNKVFKRCRWTVRNLHLWETLNSYGCVPRKSLILKFPDKSIFKSEGLIRHFIRGYFDGDGCISYLDKEHTKIAISILGTEDFLNKCKIYLFNSTGSVHKSHNLTYTYSSSGKTAFSNSFNMYENANIYLLRKYTRYKDFCRLYKELYKELLGKIGKDCNVNTEVNLEITKGS